MYFIGDRVIESKEIEPNIVKAKVLGSGMKLYDVMVDFNHPLKCTCNCPHAEGKKIICKHKVAVYFKYHQKEAFDFYDEYVKYEKIDYEYRDEICDNIYTKISEMSKEELVQNCYELLIATPSWTFYDFLEKNGIEYEIYDDDEDEEYY